jgi:hypothetical protein
MPSKKKVKDLDFFNNAFQEILRINEPDPMIFYDTHKQLLFVFGRIRKWCAILSSCEVVRTFPELVSGAAMLTRFAETLKTFEHNLPDLYNKSHALAKKRYFELKNSDQVRKLQVVKNFLDEFKHPLHRINEDSSAMNFINNLSGNLFQPFKPISSMDLKAVWDKEFSDDKDVQAGVRSSKIFLVKMLSKFHELCVEVDDLIYRPDVSVEVFTSVIRDSINKLSREPELSKGCSHAFKKLHKSTSLLVEKFPEYYREAVIADNYSSIFQSFVVDVAQEVQDGDDSLLKTEFRRILMSVTKKHSNLMNNPKTARLVQLIEGVGGMNLRPGEEEVGDAKSDIDEILDGAK